MQNLKKSYDTINDFFADMSVENYIDGGDTIHFEWDGENYKNITGVFIENEYGDVIASFKIGKSEEKYYKIVDSHGDVPSSLYSFSAFRSKDDALKYIYLYLNGGFDEYEVVEGDLKPDEIVFIDMDIFFDMYRIIIPCTIRYKDNDSIHNVFILVGDNSETCDDDIFFNVDTMESFFKLLHRDNGEDFEIIHYYKH